MEVSTFLNFVQTVGEDKILGFGYDNSGSTFFTVDKPFSLANHYDTALECLVFEHRDNQKIPYKVYKPVETIQCMFTVDNQEDMKRIITRNVF